MAWRPQDEHDRIIDLEKQVQKLRNSYATFRNNGVAASNAAYGVSSKTASINNQVGSWALTPVLHNVGSVDTNGAFHNDVADINGRYHIQLKSTSIKITGSSASLAVSYIDGTQNEGQFVTIRADNNKTLVLKASTATDTSQGNIKLDSDLSLDSTHGAILQFFSDIGTGAGKYVLFATTGTGGSVGAFANLSLSNLTSPTAINQDLIFGDGTAATARNIINIDTVTFKSSVANKIAFNTSGDGKVLNLMVNGVSDAFDFSNSAIGAFNVFEVHKIGMIKVTNLLNNPALLNETLGEYAFDGYDGTNTHNQISYGIISCNVTNATHLHESGDTTVTVLNNGSIFNSFTFSGLNLQNISLAPLSINQSGLAGPLVIDTIGQFAKYACSGGHVFTGTGGANRFGIGSPNIFYAGISLPVNNISNASYTVDATNGAGTDVIITMNDNIFTRNVTLPNATSVSGRFLIIKNVGTKAVFLVTVGGQTVDGQASGSYSLPSQYNSVELFSNGLNWLVSAKV